MSDNFKAGQKVWCYYHHTYLFKPTKCGEVLCKLPYRRKHHFSKNKDGKCFWYFVLMENNIIVLMPETCMDDLNEAIEKHDSDNMKCPRDVTQLDAWMSINQWQVNRIRYLNK